MEVSIQDVRKYWNEYPADLEQSGLEPGSRQFFEFLRHQRYVRHEPFLKQVVQFENYTDRHILEIGCGMGSDAMSFASAGAHYNGIDLGPFNVKMTQQHLACYGLQGSAQVMDAESLDWPDNSIDLVYSHGVIHHSPNTERIVEHIYRVLKPGGKALIMVYHKHSFKYYVEIMMLRRLGLLLLGAPAGVALTRWVTKGNTEAIEEYAQLIREEGLGALRSERMLSISTDLANNPLSKAYTRKSLSRLFDRFVGIRFETHYMDWRRFPLLRSMPRLDAVLASHLGWFLFIHARKPM